MKEDLKAYIDGETSFSVSESIREQLENDPELREEESFLRVLGDEIRAMAIEPQVQGADRVLAKVSAKRPFLAMLPGWAIAAVVLGVVAPGAFLTWSKYSSPSSADSGAVAMNSSGYARLSSPAKMEAKSVIANGKAGGERIDEGSFGKSGGFARRRSSDVSGFVGNGYPDHGLTGSARAKANTIPSDATITSPRSGVTAAPKLATPNSPTLQGSGTRTSSEVSQWNNLADTRMVVQNATLDVKVADVSLAQSEAMNYAKGLGGFVESSQLDKSDDENPTATLTLRVPVRTFTAMIDHLKGLAKRPEDIANDQISGEDVTGQYADATARLDELGAEEDSYVTMLRGARNVGQILEIKDRLSSVRQEIQSLHAQAKALAGQSAMSTVNVTFETKSKPAPAAPKPAAPKGWASSTWSDSVDGLASVGRFLAMILINVFVFSPVWAPVLITAWVFARRRL